MNPYAPPTADVDTTSPPKRSRIAYVVAALTLIQLLGVLLLLDGYWVLVKTGAVSVVTALGGLIGSVLLSVGAVRFALNADRGHRLFIAAFVLVALSLLGWGVRDFWTYPYSFAAVIAVTGAWFSRRRRGGVVATDAAA